MIGERLHGYCTVNEAAEELGLSREGVHRLIKRRELAPVYYLGEPYVIPLDSIADLRRRRALQRVVEIAEHTFEEDRIEEEV